MQKKNKKSRLAFPLGLLTVILAVIGLAASIKWGAAKIAQLNDKSASFAEYEKFLKPVVMFDPDAFDDVNSADVSSLANCAVWSIITGEGSTDKYSYSEGNTSGLLLPENEVVEELKRLFGEEIDYKAAFSSLDMSDYDITYDSARGGFIIPITSLDVMYVPKVISSEEKGSAIILKVGYISALAYSNITSGEYTAPEPDKYMQITLRSHSTGSGYYVSSIQAADTRDIAVSSQPTLSTKPAVTKTTQTEKTQETEQTEQEETSEESETQTEQETEAA